MYLRRESARMPASTFQAYPVYPGDCREIKGSRVFLPRLFLPDGRWEETTYRVSRRTADRVIVEHSVVLANN